MIICHDVGKLSCLSLGVRQCESRRHGISEKYRVPTSFYLYLIKENSRQKLLTWGTAKENTST